MPIWPHERLNWDCSAPTFSIVFISCLQKYAFSFSSSLLAVAEETERQAGSKVNRNLAHSVCYVFLYAHRDPFIPSFMHGCGIQNNSLNPPKFGDPKSPAWKILTCPYYSLKSLYGVAVVLAPHNQWILLGTVRSPWIFANVFITWNICCMLLCIFGFG